MNYLVMLRELTDMTIPDVELDPGERKMVNAIFNLVDPPAEYLFRARFQRSLGYREIGAEINVSHETARQQFQSAKSRLQSSPQFSKVVLLAQRIQQRAAAAEEAEQRPPTEMVSARLPVGLIAKLDEFAMSHDSNRTQAIEALLWVGLAKSE